MSHTMVAERKNSQTFEGTLAALNFKAESSPVYDESGKPIEGFQRIWRPDIGATLSIMTDKYKMVQHQETMVPAVEALGKEGWRVKASHIERKGASAYVELTRNEAAIKVVGEKVGERILMRNTYDGTSTLRISFGTVVLICGNGAVVPGVGFAFNAHHVGNIRDQLGMLTARVRKIEEGLGARMIEAYSKLDSPVSVEIGREIVRRVFGERKMDKPFEYWQNGIGRNGDLTAWNLYNGITQYLTHDFTGNWGRRERKNGEAFDLLAKYIRDGHLPVETEAEKN